MKNTITLLSVVAAIFVSTVSWGQSDTAEVRVITYNLKSGQGYGESSGRNVLKRFSAIGAAIGRFSPDLLIIQESGDDRAYYNTLVATMGSDYRYRVLKCSDYTEGRRVGLFVFSPRVTVDTINHCIQGDDPDTGNLFNHWARISLTVAGKPLVVYGFKLAPRDRTEYRRRQMNLLEPYLKADLAQQRRVIVAGDLNHRPFDPEYERWMQWGLVDSFDPSIRGNGFTKMDELGDDPLVPYRRIDYLLLSPSLATRLPTSSRVLQGSPFVPTPSNPWSLSDHLPVMATFRWH